MSARSSELVDAVTGSRRGIACASGHHRIEDTGRREHAGQARAGMGAGADEIEVAISSLLVVRPEPRALRQDRLQPEGGAAERRQAVLEILRRQHTRSDDLVLQAGQQVCLSASAIALAVRSATRAPVGAALQVRHRREHVEGSQPAARATDRCRRAVQIEAEIVRQHLAVEDVVSSSLVARPEQDGVVRARRRIGDACRNTRRTGSSNSAPLDARGRSSARRAGAARRCR